MAQVVGKCPDGDLKLKFHGSDRTWTFNPECATRVDADGAPLTPSTTGRPRLQPSIDHTSYVLLVGHKVLTRFSSL